MSEASAPDLEHKFRAMATDVTFQLVGPTPESAAALARAEAVFHAVEQACTRFNPDSPLMRANADPRNWHEVPVLCFDAIAAAAVAHRETDGRFDPRVLKALTVAGYDRSLPFRSGEISLTGTGEASSSKAMRRTWEPGLDQARSRVKIGSEPIDLGGIGKGLAVRWALAELVASSAAALVEAGGDVAVSGLGTEGTGWRIGVEDPRGGSEPVAVVNLTSGACATSSIRVRHWQVDGRAAHHLIDPRTARPAESGLLAVTVVGPDAAEAEVWSKSLFLVGRGGIRAFADEHSLAALWVDHDGFVGTSRDLKPHLIWQASRDN